MTSRNRSGLRHIAALLLILAVATVVRLPGLDFGYRFWRGQHRWVVIDETHTVKGSQMLFDERLPFLVGLRQIDRFISGHVPDGNYWAMLHVRLVSTYPPALPAQIHAASLLAERFAPKSGSGGTFGDFDQLALARGLSLIYGLATVLLVYFAGRRMTGSRSVGLSAALFLSLSLLHVTYSHFALADAPVTFWLWLTMLFAFIYWSDRKIGWLVGAATAAGLAIGAKFAFGALFPLLYLAATAKSARLKAAAVVIVGSVGGFLLASGFAYGPFRLVAGLQVIRALNSATGVAKAPLLGLVSGVLIMLLAVGLPVFALACTEGLRAVGGLARRAGRSKFWPYFWIFSPAWLQFLLASQADVVASRQFLPVVPLVVLAAALAVERLGSRRKLALAAITVYLLLAVVPTEYYFHGRNDTRITAAEWIYRHVPTSTETLIGVTPALSFVTFDGYGQTEHMDPRAEYLFLFEGIYRHYGLADTSNLLGEPSRIGGYSPEQYTFLRSVLGNRDERYQLVRSFDVRVFTPELALFKRYWGTYPDPNWSGDVKIYKKN